MINIKTKQEFQELCFNHRRERCKKDYNELYKMCFTSFPGSPSVFQIVDKLFPKILLHNRKEKLKKLLDK